MPILLFALILSLWMPLRADAQEVLGVSLGGGLTLAVGDESDRYGNGPTVALRTVVPMSERLALQATIGFQEIRLKQEVAVQRAGIPIAEFRPGGGFVEGGNRRSLGVMLEGTFHLLPRSGVLSPYVLAGAGFTQAKITDLNVYHLGRWALQEAGDSQIVLGVEGGAGLQVRFTPVVSVFVQGSYQNFFTEGGATTMAPIHAGLLLELGR